MPAWRCPETSFLSLSSAITAVRGAFCPLLGSVRRTLVISAACSGLKLRCFAKMDRGQGQLAWIMAFISNGERKKSYLSVVYCFSSLKHCFCTPTVETTWYRKEILTLCSLRTRNCITGQMTTTCECVKDVQHRAGRMGTSLRVSDRLGILLSFLIRWFLMPVAR